MYGNANVLLLTFADAQTPGLSFAHFSNADLRDEP